MKDPRFQLFARNIVQYSVYIQPGDNVLIQFNGIDDPELAKCLVEEVTAAGGNAFVEVKNPNITRMLIKNGSTAQFAKQAEFDENRMKQMQAFIAVSGGDNKFELSDITEEKLNVHAKIMRPVTDYRVNHTKWCIMRYPTPSMAQLANMSTEVFEDFYFDVCTLDYRKMSEAMNALVTLFDRTDWVRIVSPGTDLSFSVKGIPSVKCCGLRNIPDGEVYTAPVKDSVNGVITYNTKSYYQGTSFDHISFSFENGKIVEAISNDTKRINEILTMDEGASYIGEFAIGVNPYILHPMNDTLFDEKIAGSIHFTPGQAYVKADNGNRSAVHWDLVLIQRPEYGGGEIYFDDVLIRKDGLFVIPELMGLNPDHLK